MKKSIFIIAILAAGLTGCITTKGQYDQYGTFLAGFNKCYESGYMDADTYGRGRILLQNKYSMNIVNQTKLNEAIERNSHYTVSESECGQATGMINASFEQLLNQPQQNYIYTPPPTPRTTICNRVGTMTFCN